MSTQPTRYGATGFTPIRLPPLRNPKKSRELQQLITSWHTSITLTLQTTQFTVITPAELHKFRTLNTKGDVFSHVDTYVRRLLKAMDGVSLMRGRDILDLLEGRRLIKPDLKTLFRMYSNNLVIKALSNSHCDELIFLLNRERLSSAADLKERLLADNVRLRKTLGTDLQYFIDETISPSCTNTRNIIISFIIATVVIIVLSIISTSDNKNSRSALASIT